MKKLAFVMTIIALLYALTACVGKDKPMPTTQPAGSDSVIHDEFTGDDSGVGQGLSFYSEGDDFGIGFPVDMPLYEGYELIEVETYGDDSFTMEYAVGEAYENVVGFYMMHIPGLDESGIGDTESYFEGVEFDGIYLNGLTIAADGDSTLVYITVSYDGGNDDTDYDDADYDDGYGDDGYGYDDEENETEADYNSITGMLPDDDYPNNVVPIYDSLKLTTVSSPPSGDLFVYEGVAAPGSFEKAVNFYTELLGEPVKSFDSPAMKTEQFEGEKDGWSYSVYVADIYTSGNCVIQITLQK